MEVTSADQLPAAPRYLWGHDLHLSGWGPFARPEDPTTLDRVPRDEYWKWDLRYLCPVVYTVEPGDDLALLLFNCDLQDVMIRAESRRERVLGRPRQPVPEGFKEQLVARFRTGDLQSFQHSIVGGILAMVEFDRFKPTGMYETFEWLFETHQVPFVKVRTRATCARWYEEPGLGQTYFDPAGVPYKYRHPREPVRHGDHYLIDESVTRRTQKTTYRGRAWRPKVVPTA